MANIKEALKSLEEIYKNSRDKGTAFEDLIRLYLKNEPHYKDLYSNVETYKEWANKHNSKGCDIGIDLVATTKEGEHHAIQCKFYDANSVINKPAIKHIMLNQAIKTHKDSGITNNPNDYAINTMQNPAYPLELLLGIIHISLKSQNIITNLPNLQTL